VPSPNFPPHLPPPIYKAAENQDIQEKT
jgi:hypothetical protein